MENLREVAVASLMSQLTPGKQEDTESLLRSSFSRISLRRSNLDKRKTSTPAPVLPPASASATYRPRMLRYNILSSLYIFNIICVAGRAPPWPARTDGGGGGGGRREEGGARCPLCVSTVNTPCWRPSGPWVTGAGSQTRSYPALNSDHVIATATVQSSYLRPQLNFVQRSSLFNKWGKFYLCWAAASSSSSILAGW